MRLEHNHQTDHNSRGVSVNGSSSPHTNGSTNGYHNDELAVVRDETAFQGHNREEVTRILLQSLSDLGYKGAATQLSKESGYKLETPSVAAFRAAVLSGDWAEAESLLLGHEHTEQDGGVSLGNGSALTTKIERHSISTNGYRQGLPLADGADVLDLRFLLRRQKYLELLEDRDLPNALKVLRNDLTPLKRDTASLHLLSTLLFASPGDLRSRAGWDGAKGNSRADLLSVLSTSISPAVMIPEHRLATLLTTVQDVHVLQCKYHNTTIKPSLYTDHECSVDDFPLHTSMELRHHSDEVWFLDFSHDGALLASAGKDGVVYLCETTTWKVVQDCREFERSNPDERGICYLSFSPNDRYLIICSKIKHFLVIDVQDGSIVARGDHFDYPVTSAAWLPDSETFVIGSQSSSHPLGLYSMKGSPSDVDDIVTNNLIYSWRDPPSNLESTREGVIERSSSFRVTDVAISNDGTLMAAATLHSTIMVFDLHSKEKIDEWPMAQKIMSLHFSSDMTKILVSMYGSRVVLLDSMNGTLLEEYVGIKQEDFVIRSAFGGADESFVISGSEDSRIVIWRAETGAQVASLNAHAPYAVSTVAWHPTNHAIFASAGDDRRIRIWRSHNALRALRADASELDSFP